MGVVVRRYIDILIIIITFPYSTCISSFFDYIYTSNAVCILYYIDGVLICSTTESPTYYEVLVRTKIL